MILPEERHDSWLSREAGDTLDASPEESWRAVRVSLSVFAPSGYGTVTGRSTQKQPYVIHKSMEQFGHINIIHSDGTYDKNRKQFHCLTDQIGDPDMVRV
jgi:hypothetical protein